VIMNSKYTLLAEIACLQVEHRNQLDLRTADLPTIWQTGVPQQRPMGTEHIW